MGDKRTILRKRFFYFFMTALSSAPAFILRSVMNDAANNIVVATP